MIKTVDLLIKIKYLLKDKGMTIKGVKNALNIKDLILTFKASTHKYDLRKIKRELAKISNIIKKLKK